MFSLVLIVSPTDCSFWCSKMELSWWTIVLDEAKNAGALALNDEERFPGDIAGEERAATSLAAKSRSSKSEW